MTPAYWLYGDVGHALPLKIAPSYRGSESAYGHVVPWVHPTPHPQRHLDRISQKAQLKADSPEYLTMGPLAQEIALSHGGSGPLSHRPLHCSMGRPRVLNPNVISIGSAALQRSRQSVPILYNGTSLSQKLPLRMGI